MNVDDTNPVPAHPMDGVIADTVQLPPLAGSLPDAQMSGQTLRIDGTNVVRVPFGVRQPRRSRPARPERWATVVIPFQLGGSTPPPPQAA